MTKDDLERLLERVERATEGCVELDGLIAKSVMELALDARYELVNAYGQEVDQWYGGHYGAYKFYNPEPYSTSLDAIVGLIERDLPGWQWATGGAVDPYARLFDMDIDSPWSERFAAGVTPALALCAAFIRAKLALPQKDSGT